MKNKEKRINCFKCKYFYVTWQKAFPYGCKGLGFKTRQIPSLTVVDASGLRCLKFEAKKDSK